MRRLIPLALAAFLTACAHSEPKIEVREVKIAVPVKCTPENDPRATKPVFPDSDEALAAAPNIFIAAQLAKAGRKLRIAYEGELEAALSGCTGDPPAP